MKKAIKITLELAVAALILIVIAPLWIRYALLPLLEPRLPNIWGQYSYWYMYNILHYLIAILALIHTFAVRRIPEQAVSALLFAALEVVLLMLGGVVASFCMYSSRPASYIWKTGLIFGSFLMYIPLITLAIEALGLGIKGLCCLVRRGKQDGVSAS